MFWFASLLDGNEDPYSILPVPPPLGDYCVSIKW